MLLLFLVQFTNILIKLYTFFCNVKEFVRLTGFFSLD